jgi:hypothetical protein
LKRILMLTALVATLAVGAIASPAGAGPIAPPLSDLTVSPNTGRPGDAFTVSGSGCERIVTGLSFGRSVGARFAPRGNGPSQNFSVQVAVAFPAPVATTTIPSSDDGSWSVDFVVPQGTPPGVYEVAATCLFDDGGAKMGIGPTPFPYESSTYTVPGDPAAPAAPVPGTPTFTG